jgi:hypothetical protein
MKEPATTSILSNIRARKENKIYKKCMSRYPGKGFAEGLSDLFSSLTSCESDRGD